MKDDLAAALARLLEPTTVELADEDRVEPYWATSAEARDPVPASAAGFAPDLANLLSDAFAAEGSGPPPSMADIAAYVDGRLDGVERESFEAALVASPELRAEVEMLVEHVALHGDEDDVTFASDVARDRDAPRPR